MPNYRINQSEFIGTRGQVVPEYAVLRAVGRAGLEEKVKLGHIVPTEEAANAALTSPAPRVKEDSTESKVLDERNELLKENEQLKSFLKHAKEVSDSQAQQLVELQESAGRAAIEDARLRTELKVKTSECEKLKDKIAEQVKELAQVDSLKRELASLKEGKSEPVPTSAKGKGFPLPVPATAPMG